MAVSAPDLDRQRFVAPDPIRVLRWTYRRSDEAVVYELGLDRHDSSYELKLNPAEASDNSIEVFRDAIAALMRQAAIERALVNEGWSLERFESDQLGM